MSFIYFSWQILFSRTFQGSPVYSSTFQACANPVIFGRYFNLVLLGDIKKKSPKYKTENRLSLKVDLL